ncbi:MAG: hypothetical protein EPN17_11035 [Methylobacter sp.]|nr:MAG: hypothetical protein EPN17_11035 [Methylobacter sp.]
MQIPQPYLEKLNTMSADDFAEWLLTGFRSWGVLSPQNTLFAPIGLLLSRNEYLGVQLAELYETLNANAQSAFKLGIALGIGRCRDNDEWQPVLRQLVWLAKSLKASATLQPIFLLLKGFLKTADSPEALRSRAFVINTLAGWVGEPEVVITLQELLKAQNFFHKTDVPVIFINLLKAHPERLAEYVRHAGMYFFALEKEQKLLAKPLVFGLIDKMGRDNLARYLPDLRVDQYGDTDALDDSWMLRMLFCSESPLKLYANDSGFYIRQDAFCSVISNESLDNNYELLYWLNSELPPTVTRTNENANCSMIDAIRDKLFPQEASRNLLCQS